MVNTGAYAGSLRRATAWVKGCEHFIRFVASTTTACLPVRPQKVQPPTSPHQLRNDEDALYFYFISKTPYIETV